MSPAYDIAKQAGGYIFVDSKAGKETNIKVYLPPYALGGMMVSAFGGFSLQAFLPIISLFDYRFFENIFN